MYFMNQNKKKEATKQKEREEKAKLKDVNMAAPSFDRKILNDQHQREKDAKAKERAQPKENAKFDMAVSLMFVKKYEKYLDQNKNNFFTVMFALNSLLTNQTYKFVILMLLNYFRMLFLVEINSNVGYNSTSKTN